MTTPPAGSGDWRPTQFDGYWVNSVGQVWSLKTGRLIAAQHRHAGGYITYGMWVDGRQTIQYAHALVLTAFVGTRPEGNVACHKDGNPKNNAVANLMWGDYSTNLRHRVGHGRHWQANKTECSHGHPFDEANTYINGRGNRECKACIRENGRRYRARLRARSAA